MEDLKFSCEGENGQDGKNYGSNNSTSGEVLLTTCCTEWMRNKLYKSQHISHLLLFGPFFLFLFPQMKRNKTCYKSIYTYKKIIMASETFLNWSNCFLWPAADCDSTHVLLIFYPQNILLFHVGISVQQTSKTFSTLFYKYRVYLTIVTELRIMTCCLILFFSENWSWVIPIPFLYKRIFWQRSFQGGLSKVHVH